ncbi:uncharacterized protein RJT21DRAFT_35789 [Scheffersomyces amazonensis]|uniref:uncharacterized protein n=1 Tax=Scheffersomyces amazonensis TaxID=1078765 RepID=UPI00315CF129
MSNSNLATMITKSDSNISMKSNLVGSSTDKVKQNFYPSQKQGQKQKARIKQKPSKSSREDQDYYNDYLTQQIETQIKQGGVAGSNSRKNKMISIDHLFEYQSYRDSHEFHTNHNHSKNNRRGSNSRSKRDIIHKIPLKGMSFINVNYKFIVDYSQDYKSQEMDPNIPVNVKDIMRIIVPKGNACPICLTEDPIAPRMITTCGHIVCLKCLLSLLDSELPEAKKRESSAVIEKYKECPLCSSIIRKNDVKPVLINNVDDRFEVPKIRDEVVLTLMARPQDKIMSLPKSYQEYHEIIGNFPWYNQTMPMPDCNKYARIFKGNLKSLTDMYEFEKAQIHLNYEEEKELYHESYKYVQMAMDNIDDDIDNWIAHFKASTGSGNTIITNTNSNSSSTSTSTPTTITDNKTFYYYQTGFDASATFVLSPLDMKVLKACYNDNYESLPSSMVAKIENIRYEELTEEASLTKYKYLSHLPIGTQLGFLECNWKGRIKEGVWAIFKEDLTKRSLSSNRKFKREERNRRRALNQEEIRNRNFFIQENNGHSHGNNNNNIITDGSISDMNYSDMDYGIGSLSISDNRGRFLPVLEHEHDHDTGSEGNQSYDDEGGGDIGPEDTQQYETTVWGTKIPKRNDNENNELDIHDSDDGWDAEEMIRKAREEMERQEKEGKKGRKKKKKLILLSSNSNW